MGSLDQPTGTSVSRYIKFVDVSGYTPDQIETAYNNQYGKNGWRIIQVAQISNKIFLVAEKEY